ncbi:uncharacterized protein LOC124543017 [Vanessa cardui]|uniref:uncharacterized protein LOC124543017 n=1 Tax=Vanessa cardui TaxID=171605 RepID=UPI001F1394DD|nr:uncharacterized protein LOC124543017 [Vanessa cardui]XP_046976967.1 uncharacterized protein LOC124543017 [Vanessa cardui]XP_046976968.1 uncharacterized protein LOC124543017 [Vanessa cardui]XP_046976969.1 uncharacterized protein LOC124543017 [Vanessa cardui]XP_046976970.1 uncharacterized protein LOC124543017 [Vanessa cardui]
MKCAGCFISVNEATSIGCIVPICERRFCNDCISINSLTSDRMNQWLCPECSALENNREESTLLRSNIDSQNITLLNRPETLDSVTSSETFDLQNLLTEVRLLTQEINRCHERIDVLEASVISIESQESERENHEIEFLKCTIGELQAKMNAQTVNHLKNEIELCGIPELPSENATHIALHLAKEIGVELSDQDIDWTSRAGPRILPSDKSTGNARKHPRPIVVRLLQRSKRDEIIKASKTRRNITSTDLGLPGPAQKVFINERLTQGNRLFFRECRTQSKRMGYNFCWCNNGVIYVREREGKSAIVVRNYEDLERLINKKKKTAGETTIP